MGYTQDILDEVRKQLAPMDATLTAARDRRDLVLDAALAFPGALRTYPAGSIAHRVANDDTDADCGVVLDRRSFPDLGPDGEGVGPKGILESVRTHLRESMHESSDDLMFRVTKRAIKVFFHDPLWCGTDPTVDLVVALNRLEGALWIPNLEQDRWDASAPDVHTQLLTADPANLRRTRARVIRLAKGWNKQFTRPGLSGFNISALALQSVEQGAGVARSLTEFFDFAARDLQKRRTPDPAGVSGPIKILIDRGTVVRRLKNAARRMEDALENDGDEKTVRDALADVFHQYVDRLPNTHSMGAVAASLRGGNSGVAVASGSITVRSPLDTRKSLKNTRAYGGRTSFE